MNHRQKRAWFIITLYSIENKKDVLVITFDIERIKAERVAKKNKVRWSCSKNGLRIKNSLWKTWKWHCLNPRKMLEISMKWKKHKMDMANDYGNWCFCGRLFCYQIFRRIKLCKMKLMANWTGMRSLFQLYQY